MEKLQGQGIHQSCWCLFRSNLLATTIFMVKMKVRQGSIRIFWTFTLTHARLSPESSLLYLLDSRKLSQTLYWSYGRSTNVNVKPPAKSLAFSVWAVRPPLTKGIFTNMSSGIYQAYAIYGHQKKRDRHWCHHGLNEEPLSHLLLHPSSNTWLTGDHPSLASAQLN